MGPPNPCPRDFGILLYYVHMDSGWTMVLAEAEEGGRSYREAENEWVFVSERQAGGGQGLGNPHGEHGEECYDLRDVEISEGVRLVVREGRDTERVL